MTSLLSEQPQTFILAPEIAPTAAAPERAEDALAGRTVWCATGLPGARRRADALRADMDGGGPGVAGASLHVSVPETLREVAGRLERTLAGAHGGARGTELSEHDANAQGAHHGDDLVRDGVREEDVVVVHDMLGAIVAQAVRERGVHVVWRVRGARVGSLASLELLQRLAPGVDAYLASWPERGTRREVVDVVAAMPSTRVVAIGRFPARRGGEQARRLAWRTILAQVVSSDRGECVGGTLHARPAVAAR